MRRYLTALALAGFAVALCLPSSLYAQGVATEDERILKFESNLSLKQDGTLEVQETIQYDFGDLERHGIFRNIPLRYDADRGNLSIRNIQVTDENGGPYEYSVSGDRNYKEIKIGDPDSFVTGVNTYVIRYEVSGAIQWGEDYDSIIWNVTGNEWNVPIENTRVQVKFSAETSLLRGRAECYQGPLGSVEACPPVIGIDQGIRYQSSRTLSPGEGLTISVSLPKGGLIPPTWWERFLENLQAYWPLVLPLAAFVILFRRWWHKGRDPKGRGTIVPQYEPPDGLSPIEIGILSGGTVKPAYISAQIIFLATRGYLKITPLGDGDKPDDYLLEKLKNPNEQDPASDHLLMNGLFLLGSSIQISSLKNIFHKFVSKLKGAVSEALVQKGLYDRDPSKIIGAHTLVAFVICFVSFFFMGFWPLFAVSSIAVAAIVFIFGWLMPKVTPKGALDKEYILGFKDYLNIAEKDRLDFHNAPEKRPELFEKFLPYALALGVSDAWAKEFKDIYVEPPSWYGGSAHGPFLAASLASDLGRFSTVASNTAFASSGGGSGSSGGFSGGGAGGGGGGSW